jgi:hypothetical protein
VDLPIANAGPLALDRLARAWFDGQLMHSDDDAPSAALVTEAQTDPAFAAEYLARFVEPRRAQAAEVFRRAIERGEIPADTKIEVVLDLIYGPIYHRLLHGHAPLNERFVRDVVDAVLGGIMPGAAPAGGDPEGPGPGPEPAVSAGSSPVG